MRRKLRRHFAFLMAVLMMLSLMGVQVLAEGVQVEAVQTTEEQIVPCSRKKQMRKRLPDQKCRNQTQKNLHLSLEQ